MASRYFAVVGTSLANPTREASATRPEVLLLRHPLPGVNRFDPAFGSGSGGSGLKPMVRPLDRSERVERAIVELRATIRLPEEIALELGLSVTKVRRLSAKNRPKLVSSSVDNGLDYEKLEAPFRQLGEAEKTALMERNASRIDEMTSDFKGKPAEFAVRKRVSEQIRIGLGKYHPDIMSESHFIQLVAKKALISYSRKNLRAAGFRAQNPSRKRREYVQKNYPDEACDFLQQALPRLMQVTEAHVSFEQARDDIMQEAALRILQNFRPDLESKGEFVVQQVEAAARRYFATEKTEQIKAFGFYLSMIAEIPELQNRPRPKASLNDGFNGCRELMRV